MKYRLKKDLPFAKVGEVIDMGICGTFENIHLRPNKTGECRQNNLKMMRQDGWIEEIKPREWWVVRRYNVGIVSGFDSESLAVSYVNQTNDSPKYQIIKVREVLE